MSRRDGRGPSQLRPLSSERGPLARADGSARFSHGGTAVLCAVYGPAEVKLRNERVDRAHIEITVKPATGSAGREREREGGREREREREREEKEDESAERAIGKSMEGR